MYLFSGNNRILSANLRSDNLPSQATLAVTYSGDDYNAVLRLADGDLFSNLIYKHLDSNGSYEKTQIDVEWDFDEELKQWVKDYTSTEIKTVIYDEYGLELKRESHETDDDDDENNTYDNVTEADVKYDDSFGYPLSYESVSTSMSSDGYINTYPEVKFDLSDYHRYTGIPDISIDNTTDGAVYYNLQGVRIEAPEPGSVYIRVIGDNAEKTFIR